MTEAKKDNWLWSGEELENYVGRTKDGVEDDDELSLATLQDDEDAERYLESIRALRAELGRDTAHRDKELERIYEWFDEREATIKKRIDRFAERLREYLMLKGKKTMKLINGTVKTRAGSISTVVHDVAAFMKWAEKHPQYLRIKKEPDKTAIKKAHDDSEIVFPGVKFEKGEASLTIDT